MTNAPALFNYKDRKIRVIEIDSQPWFVATDVCTVLGHANPTVAVRLLVDDERSKADLGGGRTANIISESGLYRLIMRSDKREG